MRATQADQSQTRHWGWSLAAVCLCMLLASRGSHLNYSYWKDELVSAAAIRSDWLSLYRDWIIPDTAPPLYATLLKIWTAVWGEQEQAVRAMSLTLTLLSLLVTAWARLGSPKIKSIGTILFLGLSPTLIGHAQEARNYALALFFSTCLIAIYSKDTVTSRTGNPYPKPNFIFGFAQTAIAILLSLSHYFGLLFAITAICIHTAFQRDRKSIELTVWTIAAMLIWPIYHLAIASRAEENLSRVEWINVQPVIGTLQEFMAGIFPVIGIQASLLIAMIGIVPLLKQKWRQAVKHLYVRIKTDRPDSARESALVFAILLAFASLLIAVDIVHPLSTARNYIVALPAAAFLFGDLIDILMSRPQHWIRVATLFTSALILSALLNQSIEDNARFTRPLMNYKAIASAVNESNACREGCFATRTYDRLKVYFNTSKLINLSEAKGHNPELVIGLGSSPSKFKKTTNNFPNLSCWEPNQSVHGEVFVLIKDPQKLTLKERGFTPCERV